MSQKFFTGDVVRYVGKSRTWLGGSGIHIIHETDYLGKGKFEYSTNRGAWFSANDFELVRKADADSFKELDSDLREEGAF